MKMSRNEKTPSARFITGLLLGAGLGGIAYFLYKTKKGKQIKNDFASTLKTVLQELDSQEEKIPAEKKPVKTVVQQEKRFKRVRKFFHRKGKKLN
jgi:gas vesicle protein